MITYLLAPWRVLSDLQATVLQLHYRIRRLERRVSLTEAALVDLDQATNEVADELDELRAAVEGFDSDVAAKIGEKAARLRQLAADPDNPVPDPEPEPA